MKQHHIVCGLGFGDEGKGTITDYLVRKHRHDYVVRYNGGAQAAHHVVLPDGRWHCFSQFGSGAFHGAATFLSQHMVVDPGAALHERHQLLAKEARGVGMFVDERALVTTPWHKYLGRVRAKVSGHGSTGMGVGATRLLAQRGIALRVGDLDDDATTSRRIKEIAAAAVELAYKISTYHGNATQVAASVPSTVWNFCEWATTITITEPNFLKREIADGARCVFEGAQGLLLDPDHGWMPHCTWSNCTAENALALLAEADVPRDACDVIGVLRAYHTRHGAGPLPTEIPGAQLNPKEHNKAHEWQGEFRWGHFDAVLARHALRVVKPDTLAVTCLDLVPPDKIFTWSNAYRTNDTTWAEDPPLDLGAVKPSSCLVDWVDAFSDAHQMAMLGKIYPLIRSTGPTWKDKQEIDL